MPELGQTLVEERLGGNWFIKRLRISSYPPTTLDTLKFRSVK